MLIVISSVGISFHVAHFSSSFIVVLLFHKFVPTISSRKLSFDD
jgi:hypothetical protein